MMEVLAGAECSNCYGLRMAMRVMGYAYYNSGSGMKIAFFKIKTNNTVLVREKIKTNTWPLVWQGELEYGTALCTMMTKPTQFSEEKKENRENKTTASFV